VSVPAGSIGALEATRYRATQLQGSLVARGQWLIEIPAYLTEAGQGITYPTKPGWAKEVPFVDRFQIARFLGPWDNHPIDEDVPPASLDYVQSNSGSLVYETSLLEARLAPYLDAGYKPSDITLSLDNVCWAIAADGGKVGPYGQSNPPVSDEDWHDAISHFASDLQSLYGESAGGFRFKVGVEFDYAPFFDAGPQQYYRLYNTAHRAIRSVFPDAVVMPAEFTGTGICPDGDGNGKCVYSTSNLLAQAAAAGTPPVVVPRSLNPAGIEGILYPSRSINLAVDSYAGLDVVPEIHQFGYMHPSFGARYIEQGAVRANWEFQTLMGLIQQLDPARIACWDPFDQEGGHYFLNGIGYVRLLLTRYDHSNIYPLYSMAHRSGATEIVATGFHNAVTGAVAIVLSNYSPDAPSHTETPSISIPPGLIPGSSLSGWKLVRYGPPNTVFAAFQADLAAAENLNSNFTGSGSVYQASAKNMAAEASLVPAMLRANYDRYASVIQQTLNLSPLQSSDQISYDGSSTLSATLPANELIVMEYGEW
jgi:hypothetical protein